MSVTQTTAKVHATQTVTEAVVDRTPEPATVMWNELVTAKRCGALALAAPPGCPAYGWGPMMLE